MKGKSDIIQTLEDMLKIKLAKQQLTNTSLIETNCIGGVIRLRLF